MASENNQQVGRMDAGQECYTRLTQHKIKPMATVDKLFHVCPVSCSSSRQHPAELGQWRAALVLWLSLVTEICWCSSSEGTEISRMPPREWNICCFLCCGCLPLIPLGCLPFISFIPLTALLSPCFASSTGTISGKINFSGFLEPERTQPAPTPYKGVNTHTHTQFY